MSGLRFGSPTDHSARGELGELAAAKQHAPNAVIFEIRLLGGGERLAVGRVVAGGLHVADEAVRLDGSCGYPRPCRRRTAMCPRTRGPGSVRCRPGWGSRSRRSVGWRAG